MDAYAEGITLYADKPTYIGNIGNYPDAVLSSYLIVENNHIKIRVGDKEILFTADITKATKMNAEYSKYYKPAERTLDPAVGIRYDMLL